MHLTISRLRNVFLLSLLGASVGLLPAGCASTPEPSTETLAPAEAGLSPEEAGLEVSLAAVDYSSCLWSPSEIIAEFADDDPWEGFNRSMFAVNRFGMFYILRPIGWVWGGLFPRPVIDCINNVSENLSFPARAVSCLLQARWSDSGVEFLRFLTNTTIGIGGLFDPADHWFDLYRRNESFGQAFETWGIGAGPTLFLPVLNANNVRDHIGSIFDIALDVKTYLPYGVSTGTGVNRAVKDFRPFYRLVKANADPYEIYKTYSVIKRRLDQSDWELRLRLAALEQRRAGAEAVPPPPEDSGGECDRGPESSRCEFKHELIRLPDFEPENPYSDTVRVIKFQAQSDESSIWTHLSPWNSDFTSRAKTPVIPAIYPDRDPVEYFFWRPKEKEKKQRAPLAFVLPGIGSHHMNPSAVALAEVLYDAGYAVALLPSAFCWNFYESLHPNRLPGYTPNDAAAMRGMMQQVAFDLRTLYDFEPERIVVAGYSLGALHALSIAALEEKQNTLNIERYVAVNPPVDLIYALLKIDACARVVRGWSPDKIREVVPDGFGRVLISLQGTPPFFDDDALLPPDAEADSAGSRPATPLFDYRTHLSEEQAQLLTSLSFRYALRDVLLIAVRDRRHISDMEFQYRWSGRTGLYRQLDRISFEDYLEKFMLPVVREQFGAELSREELGRRAGLRALEDTLKNNEKIRIFHTLDDILVSSEDRKYLDETLPPGRLVWFSDGAHLGYLYYLMLHRRLLQELAPAKSEEANRPAARPESEPAPTEPDRG